MRPSPLCWVGSDSTQSRGPPGLCSWHLSLLPHSPPASSLTSYVDKTSAEGRIWVLLELVSRVQVGQVLSDSQ